MKTVFNGREIELWKPWTVRTFLIMQRYNFNVTCAEEAICLGDNVRQNKVRNAGKKMALELYRAGGLGAYQIEELLGFGIERTKRLCEEIDKSLHSKWD